MKKLSLILLTMLMAVNVAMADQYCFFGYSTSTQTGVLTKAGSAKCAIYIPAEVASRYKGCYINKVRVGLASKATTLKVFVTKDLNAASYDVEGTAGDAFKGTTDVQTTGSFEIDGTTGFYVGYEVTSAEPSVAVSTVYDENGCWADLGDGWKNYATDPAVKSNVLNIDARISGTKVPVDAWLVTANGTVAAVGGASTISATVKNQGYSKITKLTLAYSIDGAEEKTAELSKLNILAGKDAVCTYTLPDANYTLGLHDVKMRIVKVNTANDEIAENNAGESKLNVLEFVPAKRLFVEEWTGINCGFCPRGIVGLKTMSEEHPSQFVGVAIHNYDSYGPVAPSDYGDYIYNNWAKNSGYPGSLIMRQSPSQPSASNLETIYKNLSKIAPNLRLEVESKLSSDQKSVNATAIITPIALNPGTRYKLGFILTEDNVTGYGQANNFATGSYGECGGWEKKNSVVYEPLMHVARATYGYEGIEGSVPAELNLNEAVTYDVQIEIPSTVQNVNNLNAIAFVLDSSTGYVENAAEAPVGSNSVTGIRAAVQSETQSPVIRIQGGQLTVDGFDGTVKVYTLDGTQVPANSLQHGIYVVKGDGTMPFVKRVAY